MLDWLPLGWRIANTLLVEVVVAFAIYRFVVRHSARRRRATVTFAAAFAAFLLLEIAAGAELLAGKLFATRSYPAVPIPGRSVVRFHFSWNRTLLIGRASERYLVVSIEDDPAAAGHAVHKRRDMGMDLCVPRNRDTVHVDIAPDQCVAPIELWDLRDLPETVESTAILWDRLLRSKTAREHVDLMTLPRRYSPTAR